MSKIRIELEVDLGENRNEEMNEIAAAICLFLEPSPRWKFKYLTSRIIDGCDGEETLPTLPYKPR